MTKEQKLLVRGALAALSQNKTFPADVAAAKSFLQSALARQESAFSLAETVAQMVEGEKGTA